MHLKQESELWCTMFHVYQRGSAMRITYVGKKKDIPDFEIQQSHVRELSYMHSRDFAKMVNFLPLNSISDVNWSFPAVQIFNMGSICMVSDVVERLYCQVSWFPQLSFRLCNFMP